MVKPLQSPISGGKQVSYTMYGWLNPIFVLGLAYQDHFCCVKLVKLFILRLIEKPYFSQTNIFGN